MASKKKTKTVMSMAELSVKFGGDGAAGMLPTQSEGKEFGKGKGKGGGRDFGDDSRADGDWGRGKGGDRDGGKGFGRDRRPDADSRADTGDWFSKDKPAAGGGDDRRGGGDRGGDRGGGDRGGFGGERRGGGGGFGDRDRDGGGDRDRRPPRGGDDDGAAGKDSNWRDGPRSNFANKEDRERREGTGGDRGGGGFGDRDRGGGGFGDRDRGGDRGARDGGRDGGFSRRVADDDDNTNWRDRPARDTGRDNDRGGGRDEAPRERPRLQLKKKGETDGDAKKGDEEAPRNSSKPNPFGAAAKPAEEAPWRNRKADEKPADNSDDDGFTQVDAKKAGNLGAGKYIPPARKAEPEPVKKKEDSKKLRSRSDSESEESEEAPAKKPAARDESDESEEEEKKEAPKATGGKYVSPSQRKRMEEEAAKKEAEPERKGRFDDDDRGDDRKVAASTPSAGKYVPAHMRKQVEAQQKEEQERAERKRKTEEEAEAKRIAAKEATDAKKRQQKDEKDAKARAGTSTGSTKAPQKTKDEETANVDQERLRVFSQKVSKVIDNAKAKVSELVNEVDELLTEAELTTVRPVACLLEPLLKFCRRKKDEEVVSAVDRFAPLFRCLIKKSEMWRFKVRLLCEAQKVVYDMGLPRLSPASALIEVFFDGLYRAEVIEEKYFDFWTSDNDETPGKTKAMFQLNDFLDWLRNSSVEGETDSEEEAEKKGSDDEEEDEEDEADADLEALTQELSRRGGGGMTRPVR